jgi:hypothetical protein
MNTVIDHWLIGEIFTLKVPVTKYDPATNTYSYGTGGPNITAKDIYVEFYDAESNSDTPVLEKSRVGGVSTTGVTIDEDGATKSNLLVALVNGDYGSGKLIFTSGESHKYEIRIRYKVSTTENKSIWPFTDPVTGEHTRWFVELWRTKKVA